MIYLRLRVQVDQSCITCGADCLRTVAFRNRVHYFSNNLKGHKSTRIPENIVDVGAHRSCLMESWKWLETIKMLVSCPQIRTASDCLFADKITPDTSSPPTADMCPSGGGKWAPANFIPGKGNTTAYNGTCEAFFLYFTCLKRAAYCLCLPVFGTPQQF